jgi:hypothetical protein
MATLSEILQRDVRVLNLGLESFYEALKHQGVPTAAVSWRPPSGANPALLDRLLADTDIDRANQEAIGRLMDSQPVLRTLAPAREVLPGLKERMILHAGPPVTWERMCGPMKGAVLGAIVYEGWAKTIEDAQKLVTAGEITFDPCHHHDAVGPMAGIISPSMYVFRVQNETFGNWGHCTVNEGLGKVLRFGAYSSEVLERLKWMETELSPALKQAVEASGGINMKSLTAQALLMGDECHNRNVAATSLLLKELLPWLIDSADRKLLRKAAEFISGNVHFFLNVSMAACKAVSDSIKGLKGSSLLSAMARNGTDIGIRVAGLGDRWFTAPSGNPRGLYFPGFTEADANPDLGDSTVSEIAGIGAFAMAGAPAIVRFIGGSAQDAIKYTMEMYEITIARHRDYLIPTLDFMGSPVGVDIRRVAERGITPIINTGIAHKDPGVGQVGAGILYAPMENFEAALAAFTEIRN